MGSDITNLDSLVYVKQIRQDLIIQNNAKLVDLKGLRNLSSIKRHFSILNNKLISNTEGVENIITCGGKIEIGKNEKLSDLSSFNGLLEASEIEIYENEGLDSMNFFNSIEKCPRINIHHNPSLVSISGFKNLINPVNFYIQHNSMLSEFKTLGFSKKISSLWFDSNKLLKISGFESLDSIGFYLRIENETELKSIEGFNQLKRIDGYVNFSNLPQLEKINAFNNLRIIGGEISITNCNKLTSLSTFQTLRVAGSNIKIAGNVGMTSIKAFNLLDSCYGTITIDYQDNLRSLNAFKSLKFISNSLLIEGKNLESLNAFQTLSEIRGRFQVNQNDYWVNLVLKAEKLQNINEFSNLKMLRGLSIYSTPLLTDISGLNNLDTSYFKYLKLWYNPQFSACNSTFVCKYLEDPKHQYYFSGNAPGCNTREEILASCTTATNEWYTASTATGVFPNPCPLNSSLWFTGQEADFHLTLYTSTGQKAFEGTVSNPVNLPVNSTGLYHYRLTSAGKQKSGAVVVME